MKKYLIIILFFISSGLSFSQFYFISENVGWFGNLSKQSYKTTDGCKTWSIQNIDELSATSIQFISDSIGYLHTTGNGNKNLYKTTNQGTTWKVVNQKIGYLYQFIDKNNGYSIGSSDSILVENQTDTFYYQRLLNTTDGGYNWDSLSFIDANIDHVIRIWVHNINSINLIMNADLYKTSNAGQSWFKQTTPIKIADFWYIDSLIGFIYAGNYGTYKTTDGGNTWSKKYYEALRLEYGDSINMFSTLYGRDLFKSSDQGNTWFEIGDMFYPEAYDYFFLNKDYGYAIQYSLERIPKFYRTTDGGYTWTFVGSIPNIATNQEEYNILYQFSLEQNFPNPFNPSTKIKYTLPQQGLVTIKVYDVLGKEITTLINEEKPSGEYEVEFDGSKLSSGIYYYKIQAGEFVQTKKMVLMK
ncbi:MAG TPA: T9SS type A sorting domain-containing protein [Ignavibacteriaceae bacterium]|nr:T9SS type A sorting domain-containing protein [Ignavibacteriaceae bacterium]